MEQSEFKIYIASIVEVQGIMIKVDITGATSDFIPLMQCFNSFKTSFTPPQKGQQVLIFKSDSFMVALGDIPSKKTAPKQTSTTKDLITYSDGTTISYDINNSTLQIDSNATINVICKKANIKSNSVVIDSSDINLGGGETTTRGGIVTTECIDPFTGAPFPQGSLTVKATL